MPDFPSSISGEHLIDVHATLAAPEMIGAGPLGSRSVHIVTGGTFEGPRLRGPALSGTLHAGGGDWLLTHADYNELDVRATLETDDGALIFMHYRGVLKVEPAIMARVFTGEDVPMSEYYFRTTPRFETGHAAYAWLNSVVCVAYGCFAPGAVSYRVFAIR